MWAPSSEVLEIVAGVATVTIALVGPLYYLVFDMWYDNAVGAERRDALSQSQNDIEEEISQISTELKQLRGDVIENSIRAETMQRHIYELILNGSDDTPSEHVWPDHEASNCPFPDECPWHGPDDE